MATLLSSLSQSFRTVPPAAVPPMLDCILASIGVSPSSLFDSLLSDFSSLTKEISDDNKKMSSEQCAYLVSYLRGLCHLLKRTGVNSVAFGCFMWEVFVPLMEVVQLFEREILAEIVGSLIEVVNETNNWELMEATLVPFLLRSVGLSMDMHQNEDTYVIRWSAQCVFQTSKELHKLATVCENVPVLPLTLSCYILSCLLDAAIENYQAVKGSLSMNVLYVGKFCGHLLWDLCNLSIRMLSQSLEHRSCAASSLLPSLYKAFASKCSFKVCIQGESYNIYRHHFFVKLWKCSKVLFALGSADRRDAYGIISLYLSYFSGVDRFEVEVDDKAEDFDIRADKEFWDEIKQGLVEKEALIRKQSLHILQKILLINKEGEPNPNFSEKKSRQKGPAPQGMTKRDLWAEEEAQSLGVGKICLSSDKYFSKKQKWEAFILLYEMLEEYGTHLVEAAWNHQMLLLLHSSVHPESLVDPEASNEKIDVLGGNFEWLAILWERGLFHDNPQVRCLIMQSFLDVEWESQGNCTDFFPDDFVLGAFMQGLNDPVHHKDFGLKGVYSSKTIERASTFLHHYCSSLSRRERISFLRKLAFVAREQSLGRAGLMSLSKCILSASESSTVSGAQGDALPELNRMEYPRTEPGADEDDLIDSLRFLIENSKQHFNAKYRLKVCENVLGVAASVVFAHEVTLETLLHFIAALPREFTDSGGCLRIKVQKWLAAGDHQKDCTSNSSSCKMQLLQSLCDVPTKFTTCHYFSRAGGHYDDEDLFTWFSESERWARVLFLLVDEEYQLDTLLMLIKGKGASICQQITLDEGIPVNFLVLILSLVHELEIIQQRTVNSIKADLTTDSEVKLRETVDKYRLILEKFADVFLVILDNLVSFSGSSCSIFWCNDVTDTRLPGSVTGKLGGPSQRRLSSPMTTAVLQAIMSVRTVASVSSWCSLLRKPCSLNLSLTFSWKFFQMVVSSTMVDSETSAETLLAAYEALSFVLKACAPAISSSAINIIQEMNSSSNPAAKEKPILDPLVLTFLNHINCFLAVRHLARTRRAVLINWKWLCLEAILSMPYHAHENGVRLGQGDTFFSDDAIRFIFGDLVESLENAGEVSVLPMLRSVRMVLDLLTSDSSFVSSCHGVDAQMMWKLVRSSWILHTSCNKRRVAPIAALLSSVVHTSLFGDEGMHVADNAPGPLKWFCEKILEEGMKSPRTIRLAALHLTGLWLLNPRVIKYYMKELKLLTLYGSVAFDEDFEAELTENGDARAEVSLLAKGPDRELTETFINTELYARVSVAVLFNKLADLAEMVGSGKEIDDSRAALESGNLFLLELLDSAVNDKDLAKELYKKYSATHRRKVRVWQMICVLSRFVNQDIVQQMMHNLSISLYRNNLPAVRQYLETFAIHVYLKFPFLVGEHLVPILCDYDMKTQALSSYVFIAANVVLHAKIEAQYRHLDELLPPLIPFLTSHHHTLRGFTQLLVYQVFCKVLPALDSSGSVSIALEKRCFGNLKSYLALNPDCVRLRTSMEHYLDAFNPDDSITPAGIFSNRVEDMEFECVPMSLMEQVMNFLNDVREELRCSMAKDEVTLKNESLRIAEDPHSMHLSADAGQVLLASPPSIISMDFQKKFTFSKHELVKNNSEMEREDQLIEQMLKSRIMCIEKLKANRQQLILVASLIDRIPNLAGLARTCEVFKASGLAIADSSVVQDKQFQLISVTADKWIPIIEVPVNSVKTFLERKKREGFSILGLEQTANSIAMDKYSFPRRTVLVLGREKEGIPADIIHVLDACVEIPQLGVVRSLNVHVSGAIAIWEYTRQQRLR